MMLRIRHATLLIAAAAWAVGCDSPRDTAHAAPPARGEFIRFEYQVAPAESISIRELNELLQNGQLVAEETSLIDDQAWCQYEGVFDPPPGQQSADLIPDEQTHAPVLSAFGNPRSMGFNFLVSGYQARNRKGTCGSLEQTLQGVAITSSQGSASGSWRPGDEALAVMRPEMGKDWLGKAEEFSNEMNGSRLFFDHAVDSVSKQGFVEGRFCFLALSNSGEQVVFVRNGEFGMQSRR